jgi:hypothetical protein
LVVVPSIRNWKVIVVINVLVGEMVVVVVVVLADMMLAGVLLGLTAVGVDLAVAVGVHLVVMAAVVLVLAHMFELAFAGLVFAVVDVAPAAVVVGVAGKRPRGCRPNDLDCPNRAWKTKQIAKGLVMVVVMMMMMMDSQEGPPLREQLPPMDSRRCCSRDSKTFLLCERQI